MRDTDRRVIYTKKLLRDSLMKLMAEKPVGRISVTELCKGAGVNRGTFYSHYRQPEDVLKNIEDDLFNDIRDILSTIEDSGEKHKAILYALYRNREACRLLVSPNGDPTCISRMMEISYEFFSRNVVPTLNTTEETSRFIHVFISSGTMAVLSEWLASDSPCPPEEMADMLTITHKKLLSQTNI